MSTSGAPRLSDSRITRGCSPASTRHTPAGAENVIRAGRALLVFVKESAESVLSTHVEMCQRGRFADRFGQRPLGREFAMPRCGRCSLWCRREFLEQLDDAGLQAMVKTPPATDAGGRFTKDAFDIDLDNDTVTCPNQVTAPIRRECSQKRNEGGRLKSPAVAARHNAFSVSSTAPKAIATRHRLGTGSCATGQR